MPESYKNEPELIRGVGTAGATVLNMIDMIGVGPFITMPLIIAAMGGPQAMIGWILGAVLVMCDGLVWAELGASMPRSGGPYNYLKEIYGPNKLGRLMSFMFIWQLTFSAPLSIASGALGLSQYSTFIWPSMGSMMKVPVPLIGNVEINSWPIVLMAIGVLAVAVFLLYRRITLIEKLAKFLWVGVAIAIFWVIFAGVTNFDSALAFDFPAGAFTLNSGFFLGLGSALLISVYDYWGYYNVNFFAGEVKEPEKTIPRSIILSIAFVAVIYIVMNISILGVIPWRDFGDLANNDALRQHMISSLMERLYGSTAGTIATVLIMWTAFASVFSLLLGYSRVPYAAALDGNYFKIFAKVHPEKRFPYMSLLIMGAFAGLFCFFKLADIIAAMVVIRLLVQFIAQIVGLLILRSTRPDMPRPFKMWLYPLPAFVALAGFLYVMFMRDGFTKQIKFAAVLIVIGLAIYMFRSYRRKEYPFQHSAALTEA